jgi:CheY-like chemotaxis protein
VASILLVEDDSMISRMLSLRLTMQGHQISLAENGRVGLEMALATPYDLILMDMHMPVMDGHEATRALREAGYTGLIVAVTASVMSRESEAEAAIESGCDSYISKPVSEKFEQEVQEKLDGRQ